MVMYEYISTTLFKLQGHNNIFIEIEISKRNNYERRMKVAA